MTSTSTSTSTSTLASPTSTPPPTSTPLRAHSRLTAQTVLPSRLGKLLLARTATGLAGAWFTGQKHHPPLLMAPWLDDDPLLARASDQLTRYFDGEPIAFDLPLDLHGTPFQRAVWAALLAIPRGTTCSYGAIARVVGTASAVRAVGGAVGRNPVSVIVPCHRVVGSDRSLTGYAGGIARKQALLALEKAGFETGALATISKTPLNVNADRFSPCPA